MSEYTDAVCEKYRQAIRNLKADLAARGIPPASAFFHGFRVEMRQAFADMVLREVDAEEDGEPMPTSDAIELDAADKAVRGKR